MVPWFYAGCSFTVFAFCIQELCCLDFMILVLFTTFGIPHFEIMLPRFHVPFSFYGMCILNYGITLPRFHDSSIIYNIWHSTFWNYVASIPCSLFHLRYLNSASPILELCCLDSMFLFLFTVCAFWIMELCCLDFMILSFIYDICILHFGIVLPRFYVPSFIYGIWILHSPFWNYVASILWSLIIYTPYLEFNVFTIQ